MLSGQPRNTLENRPLRQRGLSVYWRDVQQTICWCFTHLHIHVIPSVTHQWPHYQQLLKLRDTSLMMGTQLFTLALTRTLNSGTRKHGRWRQDRREAVTEQEEDWLTTNLENHLEYFHFLNISSLSVFYPDVTNQQINKRIKLACRRFTLIYFLFKKENGFKNISFLNILWIYFLI